MRFTLNGTAADIPAVFADDRLLWLLRDHFALNGPKYGCGVGTCGACVVHVDGRPERACLLPASEVAGKAVTTIEGLGIGWPEGLHPIQKAWIESGVPQCGYCQSGQVMTAAGLLAENPQAGAEEIAATMDGVICRCGTYVRIRGAIDAAREALRGRS